MPEREDFSNRKVRQIIIEEHYICLTSVLTSFPASERLTPFIRTGSIVSILLFRSVFVHHSDVISTLPTLRVKEERPDGEEKVSSSITSVEFRIGAPRGIQNSFRYLHFARWSRILDVNGPRWVYSLRSWATPDSRDPHRFHVARQGIICVSPLREPGGRLRVVFLIRKRHVVHYFAVTALGFRICASKKGNAINQFYFPQRLLNCRAFSILVFGCYLKEE